MSNNVSGILRWLWAQLQDLLTTLAAVSVYWLRTMAVWLKGLDQKRRRLVLALALAAAVLLAVGVPRLADNPSGGSSSRSDRESTSTRTCLTCLGSGKCDDCGGSGYKYVRGSGGTRIKSGCNTCHGDGKCSNSQCKNGKVPFR